MATSRSTGTTATGKTTQTEYATDTNTPDTGSAAPQTAKYVPASTDPKPTATATAESAPVETKTPAPSADEAKTTSTTSTAGDTKDADEAPSASSVELNVPEGMEASGQYLREYISDMGPMQPQTPDDIQRHQMKLRTIVNRVLAQEGETFTQAMDMLVKAIRAHRKDVFHERYLFRGFAQLKISRGERQRFETLMSLLLTTADTKSKNAVKKTVDMNVVMKMITDNETQQKLQSYYNL